MTIIASRYEIQELVARGGMGAVYRGIDLTTGLPIAVKWLKPELIADNPQLIERFHREGDMLRQLSHPNIVKVYSTIEQDNNHYIVMEYVGGGTLQNLIAAGSPLPIDLTLQIALDIADALTRTHRLDIVHRDIKPSNVLMAPDGTPRLTDFGIARDIKRNQNLTTTGTVMGTYAYISPEGVQGESLDNRADIWSFGVMLFEMLTSKRPFDASHETAILISILQSPTPDIRLIRSDIPDRLANLIEQMLIKDPQQRIGSIRQVGAELESILNWYFEGTESGVRSRFKESTATSHNPIDIEVDVDPPTGPVSSSHAIGNAPKQNRLFVPLGWIAGFIGLAIVIALVAFLSGVNRSNDTGSGLDDTNDSIQIVTTHADHELVVLVAQIEPIGNIDNRDINRFIVEDLRNTFEVEFPYSNIHAFEYPEIVTSASEADSIAEANRAQVIVWGNFDTDVITLNLQIGDIYTPYPNLPLSRETIEQVANVQVEIVNERRDSIAGNVLAAFNAIQFADTNYAASTNFAISMDMDFVAPTIIGNTAATSYHRALLALSSSSPQAALDILVEGRRNRAPNNPLLYYISAFINIQLGNFQQANDDVNTAERLANNPRWTGPLYLRSLTLSPTDYEGTLEFYLQILDVRPDDWFAWNYTGALYFYLGAYDQARIQYAEAFRLGNLEPYPYPYLIMIELRDGNLGASQALLQELLNDYPDPFLGSRVNVAVFGDDRNRQNPVGPFYLAFGNLSLGQFEAALQSINEAIRIDPNIPEHYILQGFALCNLGQLEEAAAAYTEAITRDPENLYAYFLRADTYNQLGRSDELAQDISIILSMENGQQLLPYIEAGYDGTLTCRNGLNLEFE